jgi:sugar phosphate isomerase/epimerase
MIGNGESDFEKYLEKLAAAGYDEQVSVSDNGKYIITEYTDSEGLKQVRKFSAKTGKAA